MRQTLSHRYALQVRVPETLTAAIKTAAERELMTMSEYVRRVLIERLRADGQNCRPLEAPRGDQARSNGGGMNGATA
jgi:hypothetical protein